MLANFPYFQSLSPAKELLAIVPTAHYSETQIVWKLSQLLSQTSIAPQVHYSENLTVQWLSVGLNQPRFWPL